MLTKYYVRFLISLLLLALFLFEIALIRQSPQFARGPLAAISLHNAQNTVFVVGNRLRCNQETDVALCQLEIEAGAVLEIRMQPAPQKHGYLFNYAVACQATFLAQPLHCDMAAAGLIAETAWPAVVVADALPISNATMTQLQRQNLLLNIREEAWVFPAFLGAALFQLAPWVALIWLNLLWMRRFAISNPEFPQRGAKFLGMLFRCASIVLGCAVAYGVYLVQLFWLAYID